MGCARGVRVSMRRMDVFWPNSWIFHSGSYCRNLVSIAREALRGTPCTYWVGVIAFIRQEQERVIVVSPEAGIVHRPQEMARRVDFEVELYVGGHCRNSSWRYREVRNFSSESVIGAGIGFVRVSLRCWHDGRVRVLIVDHRQSIRLRRERA
jgi:hypothetical protein